jgi:pyridinium-3,5-bisthiocarboxylic acid mononucleotide nickel chelatase
MTSLPRIAWIDCGAGVSGDMLLGAFIDLGADVADAVMALGIGASIDVTTTSRGGMRAVAVDVRSTDDQPLRTLSDLVGIVDATGVPEAVAQRARAVLTRIATAEARVHGVAVEEVHLHEIGAVDTVVDVVGVCLAAHQLGITDIVVSPVALGGGTIAAAHGSIPVPGPAVLELLSSARLTAYGGPVEVELATPTGVALVAELATSAGLMPAMAAVAVGIGAGTRDLPDRPNVVRVVVGSAEVGATDDQADGGWLVLAANVDDLDPRLWPEVIDRLLAAGAADAWLTPILMKKGRPAHTLSALAPAGRVDDVRSTMFRETSTIGVRMATVCKSALDREWLTVEVGGEQVRVKVARLDGDVVNATPEWEDVVAAARRLDRPAKAVLADAAAAAALELS